MDVNRNEVLNQDALLEELNAEVTDVCVEAMTVESNAPIYRPQIVRPVNGHFLGGDKPTKIVIRIPMKMNQNCFSLIPNKNLVFVINSSRQSDILVVRGVSSVTFLSRKPPWPGLSAIMEHSVAELDPELMSAAFIPEDVVLP